MGEPRKRGRPRLPEGERMDVIIKCRVTQAERDLLTEAAGTYGDLPVSIFIRDGALNLARRLLGLPESDDIK